MIIFNWIFIGIQCPFFSFFLSNLCARFRIVPFYVAIFKKLASTSDYHCNHVCSRTIDCSFYKPKEVLVTNETDCNASRNTRTCTTSRTRPSATNRTSLAENIRTWALSYGRLRKTVKPCRTASHRTARGHMRHAVRKRKSADVRSLPFSLPFLNRWHCAQT